MNQAIEEGLVVQLDFTKLDGVASTGQAVIPAVVQHAHNGEVLYVGYANRLAIETTLAEQIAVFWSTSRNELWRKGATSGDVLNLVDVRVNCEQNSVLYRVLPATGGVCHTTDLDGAARASCYYRRLKDLSQLEFI